MGSVFNTLGFSYLSYTPNSNLLNKLSIKQRINDIQLQEQNFRLKNSKKLDILIKLYRAAIKGFALPGGNFVDHGFHKAYHLTSFLKHVSPLWAGVFGWISVLIALPFICWEKKIKSM